MAAGIAGQLASGDITWQLALLFIIGPVAGATQDDRIDEVKLSRGLAGLLTVLDLYLSARNGILTR